MRLLPLATLLALPFLAACGGDTPQQQAPAETPAAVETPAEPEAAPAPAEEAEAPVAAPAEFPDSARPLLGTWAADLGNCGDAQSTVTISETRLEGGGRSCDIALTRDGDGYVTGCESEQLKLIPVFAPSGEGINIDGPDDRQTVLRCSR